MLPCVVFVAFAANFVGSGAFQWTVSTPLDNATVYTCEGGEVTFPWGYTLDDTETLVDIKWFRGSSILASYAGGHFFTEDANVHHVPTAGLRVSEVKVNDTYSVTVDVASTSGLSSYSRSVSVLSVEPPVLADGHLEVQLEPTVHLDTSLGQWYVRLSCGQFQSMGQPPTDVLWKSPSGREMKSSTIHNGSFVLMVYHPVETGDYTCLLNTTSPHTAPCLDPLLAQASLAVEGEEVGARVLEAENRQLKDQVHVMAEQLHQLHGQVDAMRKNESDMAARLKDCPLTTTTTPLPTTTTTAAPATTATTTPVARSSHTPCVDTTSHCELFVRKWQCHDAGQGSLYGRVCRRYCGFCNEPLIG